MDFGLGPHAHFIVFSYAAVALVLGALIAWLIADGARLEKQIRKLSGQSSKNGTL